MSRGKNRPQITQIFADCRRIDERTSGFSFPQSAKICVICGQILFDAACHPPAAPRLPPPARGGRCDPRRGVRRRHGRLLERRATKSSRSHRGFCSCWCRATRATTTCSCAPTTPTSSTRRSPTGRPRGWCPRRIRSSRTISSSSLATPKPVTTPPAAVELRRQIEALFTQPRVQYDLVRDTSRPVERYETGQVRARQTLRRFTAGDP